MLLLGELISSTEANTSDAFALNTEVAKRNQGLQKVGDFPSLTVYALPVGPEPIEQEIKAPTPHRPAVLQGAQLEEWEDAVVKDMFRKNQGQTKALSRQFDGLQRPGACDSNFMLPLANEADLQTDMVYVAHGPDVRGRFDVKKSLELGVPNGPARGKLTKGESIEVDDPNAPGGKRVVRPEDCLVGGTVGAILVVVQCSPHNIDRLTSHEALRPYLDEEREHNVRTVVHEVTREVWEDPRYQAWLAQFGPETVHLVAQAGETEGPIHYGASAWQCLRLNMIDPTMFPLPHFAAFEQQPQWAMPPNATRLVPGLTTGMYPATAPAMAEPGLKAQPPFPSAPTEIDAARAKIAEESPDFAAACTAAQAAIAAEEKTRQVTPQPGDDIVVTTLGTGSAIPAKYRNVSATHLDVPDMGGILLDCGEGTLGQLRRRYGPELPKVLADLRMIFVSHMHADHHLGLTSILAERFRLGITSRLYLLAPLPIANQLAETASWQAGQTRAALDNVRFLNINRLKRGVTAREAGRGRRSSSEEPSDSVAEGEATFAADVASGVRRWPFANFHRDHPDQKARFRSSLRELFSDLNLSELRTPFVAHRGAAFGLCLSHASGWKLAYSGDTKPCGAFVQAGEGADVLIHEATLEDEKPDVAEAKGHSTFGQAIDVGRKMRARHVVLNHFSQRYPKVPDIAPIQADGGFTPDVAISFDLMSLRAGDSWKMQHYMDAVGLMYASEEAEEAGAGAEDGAEADGEGVDSTSEATANGNSNGNGNGKTAKGKGKKAKLQQDLTPAEKARANKQKQKEVQRELQAKKRAEQAAAKKRGSDASVDMEGAAKKARAE